MRMFCARCYCNGDGLPGDECREAGASSTARDKAFDEAQQNVSRRAESNSTRSRTRLDRIGLAPMSPAPSQEPSHDPIPPSDIDERIKALGRDAAEYGFELLLVGTRDRIARLESDLAACDRSAGQREAAFRSTSAT